MKILIAVMSCQRDALNDCHQAIRETWVTQMVPGLDYRIFVGNSWQQASLAADEERLDVADGYYDLPHKSQAIRRWALERGYDFVFKADRDTYLSPKLLLNSGFEKHDYLGHFPAWPVPGAMLDVPDPCGRYPYASGGCGYWTSRRAMEVIANAPIDDKCLDSHGKPAEDLWMPAILYPAGIRGFHDQRYQFKGQHLHRESISVHLGCGTDVYEPWMMREAHRGFMG